MPYKLNLLGLESKVSNNIKHLGITRVNNRKNRHKKNARRREIKQGKVETRTCWWQSM